MAEIHWLKPVNGNFDKAKDWSGGVVPGSFDDAFLDAPGTNDYTVKINQVLNVGTVQLDTTATLYIASGALSTAEISNAGSIIVGRTGHLTSGDGGSEGDTNSGTMVAEKGGYLWLENEIDNKGLISVDSKSFLLEIQNTFVGSGTIDLAHASIVGGIGKDDIGYLTNVDNLIEGSGVIGSTSNAGKRLSFTNEAAGVVDANTKGGLTFDTGVQTIMNAGLIEATNDAVCQIKSTVSNTGTLEAAGGTLMLERAVTGSGKVAVAAGTLAITNADAAETVGFTGKSGTLELDRSQTYSGSVKGFSLTGQTTLDLRDIGFVSPGEATFSGTASSGVLTVTDGTHTAHISMVGDYTGSTFVASSDGKGGVSIVDPGAQTPSAAHFAGAMAMFGGLKGGVGADSPYAVTWNGRSPMLSYAEQR